MSNGIVLDNLSIVLHRPRYPENIGAAARAMQNMGLQHLTVVDPENYDAEKINKMATHVAADIVKGINRFDTLDEALSPYNYIAGTTARTGKQRQVTVHPSKVAETLVPLSQENRIALLFGPEDRGLSNEDTRYCHTLVKIPTAEFSSLNLAQAVMIMCYEVFRAGKHGAEDYTPRLASRDELEGMYGHLKDVLTRISFLNPENPDYWLNNMRRFFDRLPLRAKEVSIIRGICRQIDWYGEKRYKEGLTDSKIRNSNIEIRNK